MDETASAIILYKSSVNECKKLSEDWRLKERIDYPEGPNTLWFTFEDTPAGHGWLTKMGPKSYASNHYRIGGAWIHPEKRSTKICMRYFSGIVKYALTIMPGPIKKISTRSWKDSRLTKHHMSIGWIPVREFVGGFIESQRCYVERDGTYFQLIDGVLNPIRGYLDFGDTEWEFPLIKERV